MLADPLRNKLGFALVDCDHNWDYTGLVREVVLTPAAVRQFKKLPARVRSLLKKGIEEFLIRQDPTEETRNRFRLRRPSPHADFELRIDAWRVFYRVSDERTIVELIGEKQGNRLLIEGKEFLL